MKHLLRLFLGISLGLFSFSSLAQTFPDSSAQVIEQDTNMPLLPAHLSPLKKVLWGQKGFFRMTGMAPLDPLHREKELKLRRKMLVIHQVLGLTTLAGFIAADYTGQKTLDGNHKFASPHKKIVGATIGTYFATALFALLAPPPIITRKGWSNIKAHKTLAYLHFAGMILTPILAPHLAGKDYGSQGRFHQVSAYVTTALYASAIIVLKF
jgi:hypothetical protein